MEDAAKKSDRTDASEKSNGAGREGFQEILQFIEKTDLEFVQIEKNGTKLSFRRSGVVPSVSASSESEPAAEESAEPKTESIRSPIVGRFHSSMGLDRPPLVVEGGKVTAGQRVAIVEAMKIKKDVSSAVTGKIVRILVRDGDPVEYGQELMIVEPAAGTEA
jgi:biotin carboxyl carrier protein